ncbi:hypothetical protein B0A49_00459 [Cryomyces minteri]|uniref:Nucleoporin NDC1 n=1 Tax=Cryomyces minteri TaxID=331657 RepID=A0A4U0Y1W8_9PEZI|nr:hypothetical protein B0A49_00733 [Cryomyces minteri]TKA81702.1 hypothetical protein B0A49_00459 [Cryomyces minteri]
MGSRLHERSRLNERPIYLRTNFFTLAIAQSIVHLYRDYDRLVLPITSLKTAAASKEALQVAPPLAQIQKRLFNILVDSVLRGLVTTICGGFTYYLFLRSTVWSWTYTFGKYFASIPRASGPTGVSGLGDMVLRVALEGVLLTLLWEVSNAAFAANVAQEPLKKGQPLTVDSKDPNGSLIAGLKAKKEVPRNFAFWEFLLIAQRFDLRRKSLLQDIDRKGGPAWTQILAVSLSEVQGITKRISECQQPPSSADAPQQQQPIHSLPKISQPLKQDNIFASAPPPTTPFQAVQASAGQAVKSIGQSPGADPVSPKAKKLIEYGTNTLLTKEQRDSLSQTAVKNKTNSYLIKILRTPLGLPFRQTFRRRATAVVYGVPYSALNTIIYAINALTTLAVRSITEDTLGQVAKDVPTIVRVFADTIRNIENFMQTLPPHWTDVEFDEKSSRRVKEVEEVTDALKSGLEQLLLGYGEFADSLGLSKRELRGAKDLVAGGGAIKGKQMEQRS